MDLALICTAELRLYQRLLSDPLFSELCDVEDCIKRQMERAAGLKRQLSRSSSLYKEWVEVSTYLQSTPHLNPRQVVKELYSWCWKNFSLHHSVEHCLNLSSKKRRSPDNDDTREGVPLTVSDAYAECTLGSFDSVITYLCSDELSPDMRMTSSSVFLDVGSGYGKSVVHALLLGGVAKSIGIEYQKHRHEGAVRLKEHMKTTYSDLYQQLNMDLSLTFLQGDATDERHLDVLKSATHIYLFDKVFNTETTEGIMKLLSQCNFRILVFVQKIASSYDDKPGFVAEIAAGYIQRAFHLLCVCKQQNQFCFVKSPSPLVEQLFVLGLPANGGLRAIQHLISSVNHASDEHDEQKQTNQQQRDVEFLDRLLYIKWR